MKLDYKGPVGRYGEHDDDADERPNAVGYRQRQITHSTRIRKPFNYPDPLCHSNARSNYSDLIPLRKPIQMDDIFLQEEEYYSESDSLSTLTTNGTMEFVSGVPMSNQPQPTRSNSLDGLVNDGDWEAVFLKITTQKDITKVDAGLQRNTEYLHRNPVQFYEGQVGRVSLPMAKRHKKATASTKGENGRKVCAPRGTSKKGGAASKGKEVNENTEPQTRRERLPKEKQHEKQEFSSKQEESDFNLAIQLSMMDSSRTKTPTALPNESCRRSGLDLEVVESIERALNEDIKEIERQDYEAISSIYAQRSLINGRAKRVVQFEEN